MEMMHATTFLQDISRHLFPFRRASTMVPKYSHEEEPVGVTSLRVMISGRATCFGNTGFAGCCD
jgi:hypothetical protein